MPRLRINTSLTMPPLHSASPVFQFRPTTLRSVSRPLTTTTTSSAPSHSIHPSEITHFNALASSWWDPHGPSRLLHQMNPLRHDFLRDSCVPHRPRRRFLDVGCGGGIFAESAARLPHTTHVTGLDPSPEVLRVARVHRRRDPALLAPAARLQYRSGTVEALAGDGAATPRFDVVTAFEVLEHVRGPEEFLRACWGLVAPGGWLVGSTIARAWTAWVTAKVVAEEVWGVVPRGTHEWERFVQPEEVRAWTVGRGGADDGEAVEWRVRGVVYVPGWGWRVVEGSEGWGNYFFGVRKRE